MVKRTYKTLSVRSEDKDRFVKLNSDWNVLNPTLTKKREEFFTMMLNIFHEELRKKNKEKKQ